MTLTATAIHYLRPRQTRDERLARNLVLSNDMGKRPVVQAAINDLVRAYDALREEGVPRSELLDQVAGALDMARNLNGSMNRALDDVGAYTDQALELDELEALWQRLARA